jgi:hypothetical protein
MEAWRIGIRGCTSRPKCATSVPIRSPSTRYGSLTIHVVAGCIAWRMAAAGAGMSGPGHPGARRGMLREAVRSYVLVAKFSPWSLTIDLPTQPAFHLFRPDGALSRCSKPSVVVSGSVRIAGNG